MGRAALPNTLKLGPELIRLRNAGRNLSECAQFVAEASGKKYTPQSMGTWFRTYAPDAGKGPIVTIDALEAELVDAATGARSVTIKGPVLTGPAAYFVARLRDVAEVGLQMARNPAIDVRERTRALEAVTQASVYGVSLAPIAEMTSGE